MAQPKHPLYCPAFISNLALVLIAALILFTPRLDAQLSTAVLNGTVVDPSLAPVPNAKVTLRSTTQKASRETVSNSTGDFVIPAIAPGSYELSVAAPGFETQTLTGIELMSGQARTITATLKIGTTAAKVDVEESAPLLQTATATVGNEVDNRQFTDLPSLGRNFQTTSTSFPGLLRC
jgi:hypothetical protein